VRIAISLPIHYCTDRRAAGGMARMEQTDSANPIKVLLIEGNPADAGLIREYLAEPGPHRFDAAYVECAAAGLERLGAESFDAVLLGLSLPDDVGAATLDTVRRSAGHLPIVVLTGVNDEQAGVEALKSGAQDCLVKGRVDAPGLVRSIQYAITRKRLESALVERTAQLEEAVRLKDLFTDIIRHDLLDVLSVIKGALDMAVEESSGTAPEQEWLILAQRNADRLADVLKAASLYAKLEKPGDLQREHLDLTALFRAAAEGLAPALEGKRMQLEWRVAGACPALVNRFVEDVFSNLLSNAIKYSPEGQRIEVDIVDCDDRYRASVKDWGDGISSTDKPTLFTRFRRFDKKGVRGTGLGLTIVKRIVELHGGRVWVDDNPEGGSIFSVEIPKL
jgi:signal transduction histidine kinase